MSSSVPANVGVQTSTCANQLRYRQVTTVLLLFTGCAAYYFCRSDLSVAMPLLIEDLRRHGMSGNDAIIRLGTISSLRVLVYAVGKLFLTGLGDIWGGRRSFTVGLGGAFALDFGGSQAGAASSGIIDGVGYLGGVVAGDSVARLSVAFGWRGVFVALAIVTALSALAAGDLFLYQRGLRKKET